jgi:RNA polymerase sigma-70 factor (ECF subfamily)
VLTLAPIHAAGGPTSFDVSPAARRLLPQARKFARVLLPHPLAARQGQLLRALFARLGLVVDRGNDNPTSRPRTLEQLLVATAGGDRSAFSQLYDETSSRVFGLIRRLLVDVAQTEEVTQDVFLEAWQTAARFDPDRGNAVAWLLTLAHRRAVDRVRAAQAARDRDLRIGVRDLDVPVDEVAEAAEVRLEHERVSAAFADLSEAQRECISLAYYDGCTQAEIAAKLEVPLGTVKTRLRDGMIRLREVLGVTT